MERNFEEGVCLRVAKKINTEDAFSVLHDCSMIAETDHLYRR